MVKTIGNVILESPEIDWISKKDLYHENEICDDSVSLDELEELSLKDPYQVLMNNSKWPILYHFSPIRHSLLEWYDFDKEASLLEIGADCGALTGLFCDKVKKVTGIDTSYKRLLINATRNSKYDNLYLKACNIYDFESEEKYDYITLIGVFEYSDYIFDDNFADLKWLQKLKTMLTPQGKLIIALRNKYGLKYFAGAPDEYTGEMYGSIFGNNTKASGYTYEKIKNLINKAGYKSSYFYYPVPDYRMPNEIFSDDYLPVSGQVHGMRTNFDYERYDYFNEDTMINTICKDDMFQHFANSYLVVCDK